MITSDNNQKFVGLSSRLNLDEYNYKSIKQQGSFWTHHRDANSPLAKGFERRLWRHELTRRRRSCAGASSLWPTFQSRLAVRRLLWRHQAHLELSRFPGRINKVITKRTNELKIWRKIKKAEKGEGYGDSNLKSTCWKFHLKLAASSWSQWTSKGVRGKGGLFFRTGAFRRQIN